MNVTAKRVCALLPLAIVTAALALIGAPAQAITPQTLTYQGALTNAAGQPITAPVGSPLSMTFKLYDGAGGTANLLHTETQSVVVTNGVFNVTLGTATPFTTAVFDKPYFIEVTVGTGPSAEVLAPRQPLSSSAYALRASVAEALTSTATIQASQVVGGGAAVTSITAGAGLIGTPNPITSTGTLSLDPTATALTGNYVRLGGNALGGAATFGTTDNFATQIVTHGVVAESFIPGPNVPSIVGGASVNTIAAGVDGAFIGGGGALGLAAPFLAGSFGCGGVSCLNSVGSNFGVIAGGAGNRAGTGTVGADSVGGGLGNSALGGFSAVSGGRFNAASGSTSAIGGGFSNQASATGAFVGAGESNVAKAVDAFVGGGTANWAQGPYSVVAGGSSSTANGDHSTIGGGAFNTAAGLQSTVGGGLSNTAAGTYSVVAGGSSNTANSDHTAITGGASNVVNGALGFIGGGDSNNVGADHATIGGGGGTNAPGATVLGFACNAGNCGNRVTDAWGTVAGGAANRAGDAAGTTTDRGFATVSGGFNNTASGVASTVGGGSFHTASGDNSLVAGGSGSTASGLNSTVAGGWVNTSTGDYSFTAGSAAVATSTGQFVWSDHSTTTVFNPATSGGPTPNQPAGWAAPANSFSARATGGVWFVTGLGPTGLATSSVFVSPGSGTWLSTSDRASKANLIDVDVRDVLSKVLAMPLTSWNYIAEGAHVRHLGPMAQDFHAAFGLGPSDKAIAVIDAEGVAFAAIQGLNRKLEASLTELKATLAEKDALIARQMTDLGRQAATVGELQADLARIKAALGLAGSGQLR